MSNGNLGYWLFNGGNGLRGVESTYVELPDGRVVTQKDPVNPAILEEDLIVYALQHSRQARYDFCRLFPGLDVDSQNRLASIIARHPRPTRLLRDTQDFHDSIQHAAVTEDIRLRLTKKTRPYNSGVAEHVRRPGGGQ